MFAYPLPPIPTHFQLILIENQPNPTRIRVTARSKLTTKVSMKGHLTHVFEGRPLLPALVGLSQPEFCKLLSTDSVTKDDAPTIENYLSERLQTQGKYLKIQAGWEIGLPVKAF